MGDADPESNSLWDEPTMSKERKNEEVIAPSKTSNPARQRGSKRPDKPLYMPRAVRERLSLQNAQQPPEEKTLPSPAGSCTCRSSESFMPETTEKAKTSSTATEECLNAIDCVHKCLDDSPALGPDKAESEVWDPPLLSMANMTLGNNEDTEHGSVPSTDLTEEVNLITAILTLFDRRNIILQISYYYCDCPVRLRCT